MQKCHEDDVSSEKYQDREVHSRAKGIREQNQNEQAAEDLKQHRQKQNSSVEQGCKVFVQSSAFQCSMVRRKAPCQAQNGCDNGDGLVSLDNREVQPIIFTHGKESKSKSLSSHGSNLERKMKIYIILK